MLQARLITMTFVLAGAAMSQPLIKFSGLESGGVSLLPSSTPEFNQALDATRPKQLDVLLPFAVLIKNDTDQEIVGYSVRWNCRDASGRVEAGEWNRFDFSDFSGVIAPRGTELVWGPISASNEWNADLQRSVEQLLSYYSKQRRIVVRLEAVLFKDGTAVGLDGNNWITRWKAYIDSEREVYAEASRTAPAELRFSMKRLADAASDLARPMFRNEVDDDTTRLVLAANQSGTYETCHALLRGYFATRVLAMIEERNEDSAIKFVSEVIASKKYPNVYRKGF